MIGFRRVVGSSRKDGKSKRSTSSNRNSNANYNISNPDAFISAQSFRGTFESCDKFSTRFSGTAKQPSNKGQNHSVDVGVVPNHDSKGDADYSREPLSNLKPSSVHSGKPGPSQAPSSQVLSLRQLPLPDEDSSPVAQSAGVRTFKPTNTLHMTS